MTVMLGNDRQGRPAADTSRNQAVPYKRQWRPAFRALRRLLKDPDDTPQVFEIMRSLNGTSPRKGYIRLIGLTTGARQAYERTELADRLMDRDWLSSFAPGTVGAAYRDFTWSENLSADGLVKDSERGLRSDLVNVPSPIAWYTRRVRDLHDLWHILTGYGRDKHGEACLVAFSYSQTRSLGWLIIALGFAYRAPADVPGVRNAIREGFRNGRRAYWLLDVDYEQLMHEPLETARQRLGIALPVRYHRVLAHMSAPEAA
jgi:ubiquinone biosynthesis protein COQ4